MEEIELFLTSITLVPSSIALFQTLTVLRIVGCAIEKMENLSSLFNLKELWICEGKLKVFLMFILTTFPSSYIVKMS